MEDATTVRVVVFFHDMDTVGVTYPHKDKFIENGFPVRSLDPAPLHMSFDSTESNRDDPSMDVVPKG